MQMFACLLLLLQIPPVETRFEQVSPEPPLGKLIERSPGQPRAIVLLHGLLPHPFSKDNVGKPMLRDWQRAGSALVKELVKVGDVYAFAYGQDGPVDEVASGEGLRAAVRQLKGMGYVDIVLVGHSAGGLIARLFVEDNPTSGVTKVIQVCPPNAGSSWAKLTAVRKNQVTFLRSLTKETRAKVAEERRGRTMPEGVQSAVVVGIGAPGGDGIVTRESQWPEDLQRQGVPAVVLDATHVTVMRGARAADLIAELVTRDLKRWGAEQVAQVRKELFAD